LSVPEYTYKIICLANSRKTSGRCIAGKIIEGPQKGQWLRPVSARPTAEISEEDRRFEDGSRPDLYDVIAIPLKSSSSHPYQIENHLIDDTFYWSRVSQKEWADLLLMVDNVPGSLWENQSSSTSGVLDRVEESRASNAVREFGASLCLIAVSDLKVQVAVEGAAFNNAKRKVRGDFTHNRNHYRMAITDPKIESQYLAKGDGIYAVGKAIICVSLGDAYNGYAYKLIAAVFLPTATS
jgi:hypothetical protein